MIFDEDIYESITMQTSTSGFKPKRGQANRRERVRTENVNAGFDKLRKLIPTEPEDRKLSKIEILRLATSYIKHLYNLTRANSCLEADELDRRGGRNKSKQQGVVARATEGEPAESQAVVGLKSKRPSGLHHVCTFCLMISKQQQQGMLKSASKQQAARQ